MTSPPPALRPSQLNALARDLLEGSFPSIWVEGEISGLARPGSGHLYFALKDERAQVRCALFKPKSQWLRFHPRDGQQVLARGRLTLYEPRGDYQLVLDHLEEAGEGALRRAFEALRTSLTAEGLFDAGRKRPLPTRIQRLGVMTSASGAAIHDVLSVLSRRWPLVAVDLLPVPVQGAAAAIQLVSMMQKAIASGRYDALLLTRGGGSLEDLWCFNDESLVRTVAASPVPVVAAIGHEVDVTLVELAADLRAATPSAAAEQLVPDQETVRTILAKHLADLTRLWRTRHDHARQRADLGHLRLQARSPVMALQRQRERATQLRHRLDAAMAARRQAPNQRLALLQTRARHALDRRLQELRGRLATLARTLSVVNPLSTLDRGYAILQGPSGMAIRRSTDVTPGEAIRARLAHGHLQLRVESCEPPGSA